MEKEDLRENSKIIGDINASGNFSGFENSKRNYGIDLLRIIAMFSIVLLHVLTKGGILDSIINNPKKYFICYTIYIMTCCAVNCYGLISGYVYFSEKEKKIKLSKYLMLWFQVEFYSILITILFLGIFPDLVNKKQLVKTIFPVLTNEYWYFTAYTLVFFMIPWLNKIVRDFKREYARLLLIAIMIFSMYVSIATVLEKETLGLNKGMSFLWLTILYIIGAYMKKYDFIKKLNKRKLILIVLSLIVITSGYGIGMRFFCIDVAQDLLILNLSPTMLGLAIILLLIFSNLKITTFAQKVIKYVSPAVFGVYLMHMHPLIYRKVLKSCFSYMGEYSIIKIIITAFSWTLLIFVLGILIDKIRIQIFKLLKVDKLAGKLEEKIHEKIEKLKI